MIIFLIGLCILNLIVKLKELKEIKMSIGKIFNPETGELRNIIKVCTVVEKDDLKTTLSKLDNGKYHIKIESVLNNIVILESYLTSDMVTHLKIVSEVLSYDLDKDISNKKIYTNIELKPSLFERIKNLFSKK